MSIKKIFFSTCLFSLGIAQGQDFDRVGPREPDYFGEKSLIESAPKPEITEKQLDQVLLPELTGIYCVSHTYYTAHEVTGARNSVQTMDLHLSREQTAQLRRILERKFLDRPLTKLSLLDIKRTLLDFYMSIDRPVILVEIPEQDITTGGLIVVILESRLGEFHCVGNKAFKSKTYLKAMRLKSGDLIRSNTLLSDLSWLNRNPFRSVSAAYTPGEKPGTTDIDLYIQDQNPFRVYMGFENTGFTETETQRVFGGFNYGNLFNKGQIFSYQFTGSIDFKSFLSSSAHYTIPLPWRHILVFFGGYSTVHSKIATVTSAGVPANPNTLKNDGNSSQISTRYQVPLRPAGTVVQSIHAGIDFKQTNNTLDYGGVVIANNPTQLMQFLLEYQMAYRTSSLVSNFNFMLVGAPRQLFPDMTTANFNALRTGATPKYLYARANATVEVFFPKEYSVSFQFEGQVSDQRLLPSEQIGLGGLRSIRGYQERVVNADNAFSINFESKLPPIHFFKKNRGALTFLGFIDAGVGGSNSLTESDPSSVQFLCGVGPGVLFRIGSWFSFKGFFGYQLIPLGNNDVPYRFNCTSTISF